jgi:hypothetical protein
MSFFFSFLRRHEQEGDVQPKVKGSRGKALGRLESLLVHFWRGEQRWNL